MLLSSANGARGDQGPQSNRDKSKLESGDKVNPIYKCPVEEYMAPGTTVGCSKRGTSRSTEEMLRARGGGRVKQAEKDVEAARLESLELSSRGRGRRR